MDTEYQSSETIQRVTRDAFIDKAAQKRVEEQRTEKDKLHKILDKYIAKHSKTTEIRNMAKAGERTADVQLEISAEVTEILEKIKNELR